MPSKERAQETPGVSHTRSLACEIKKHTSKVTTGKAEQSGVSCAMVLTVSFALAPETGLCCLRHRRDGKHRRQFDISIGISGPHDFAVRFKLRPSCAAKASTASRANVRDDRETPLVQGHGTAGFMDLIWAKREGKYF